MLATAQASDRAGKPIALDFAIDDVLHHLAQIGQGRVMFIGNGGSASIASHLAIDFQKNGALPTLVFNDAAALTCLGNDLGFTEVFSSPSGRTRDRAISCLQSAVRAARAISSMVLWRRASAAVSL